MNTPSRLMPNSAPKPMQKPIVQKLAMQKTAASKAPSLRRAIIDALLVSILVAGVIGSALSVAFQVNATRDEFKVLQKSKQVRDQLDVEWGRLLIEQQTFGATSQIGSRAVIYLHMFSPPADQMMTLEMPNKHLTPTSQFSVAEETTPIDGAMPATSQGVEP
jgi:cell division protein FtsL